MSETQRFSMHELINSIGKVNQRVIGNYLKNYSGYHHDIRDIALTYSDFITKILISPSEMINLCKLYIEFFQAQHQIWREIFLGGPKNVNSSLPEVSKKDKRFADPEWDKNPYFNFIKQNYLLIEKLAHLIIGKVEMDEKTKKKLAFYTQQYVDAFSPSNFLFTNPEALRLAIETKGKSLWDGFNNLVEDLEKGQITQTDESAFEVGKNLAVTPGAVIYENELMQLIQYTPVTKEVYEIPLVIIPPWINKYYILDLQPKNSFVNFLIEQGISVFMISWRNPDSDMGHLKLDNYVEDGALKAIEIARHISGSALVNTLGYCLGGTLLSITCSVLSVKKKVNPVNSASFLATMIDFSDVGPLGYVIDGALIRKLERGELLHNGILNGHDMETAFNLIRANDLVWNYVVGNYLKGMKPAAFDVIFWTNDNTNLPASMYVYYMRHMILENKLSRKNALRICDTPIDIAKIRIPVFVIGLKDDNISPAATVFSSTELVSGPVEFMLGESGHVMGVVNPPSKKKYGYYLNGTLGNGFEEWKRTAKYYEGSWWLPWTERLKGISGKKIFAPSKAGDKKYHPLEPAPGRFVKERC